MTIIDITGAPLPPGPWLCGRDTVTIEEEPGPGGWSLYKLPGGTTALLMESSTTFGSLGLVILGLWRALANLARACPLCSARVRVEAGAGGPATGTMEHEAVCPIGDDMLSMLAPGPPVDPLPEGPKSWLIRPPRLTVRRKRGHR